MFSRQAVSLAVLLLLSLPIDGNEPRAQASTAPMAVNTNYFITLGGVEQYVEIRGASRDLPVLLYLHGGPGMPATPLLRYHQARLSDSFIVVSWDQRGCGRSAEKDPRPGGMTLERHVQDAHELTRHLLSTLGKQKLLLVGHSFGSMVGVELAQRYPSDYLAYVGIGQMVNTAEGEQLAREELLARARAKGDATTVAAVEAIGYSRERGYADGLTGFLAHRRLLWINRMMDYDSAAMLRAIAAAEGYSRDIQAWMKAATYAQGALFGEMMAVDLTRRTRFEIPVFFFTGRHDFNTPGRPVAEFVEAVEAPAKGMVWFDQSGHSPAWEEPEAFRARLLEVFATATRARLPRTGLDLGFLDKQIASLMEEWRVPGLSLAIVVDGETRVLEGYGVRELGRPEKVDEHTVFALASTTKAFTAAALGILVDEGRLRWDDRVAARLPGFRFRDPKVADSLTVRDLLSHRTGYAGHDALWHGFGYTRKEIVERLARLEPSWGLRERFAYQNLMYVLAGEIVESVSGQPWERFVEERILGPLQMKRSVTGVQRLRDLGNVAAPHVRDRAGVVGAIPLRDPTSIGPAGAMFSTAADMAEWVKLVLAGGTSRGRRILSPGVVREMETPQIAIRPQDDILVDLLAPGGQGVSYGLGWYVHQYGGRTIVEHPGGIEGMSPIVVLVPELRAGFVVLTNISMPTGIQFALRGEILDALLGGAGLDWPAETRAALQRLSKTFTRASGARGAAGAPPPAAAVPSAAYAGLYGHDAYGDIQVLAGERGLTVRFGERGVVSPLIPLGGHQFLLVWQSPLFPPARCTFEQDEAGRVRAVVFAGYGTFDGRFEKRGASPAVSRSAAQLASLDAGGLFFVTRVKDRAAYRLVEDRPVPARGHIVADQWIVLTGPLTQRKCEPRSAVAAGRSPAPE